MNSLEATAAVIDALEELRIPYMLVGAFSSNAYSIARSTKDADFVVTFLPSARKRWTGNTLDAGRPSTGRMTY